MKSGKHGENPESPNSEGPQDPPRISFQEMEKGGAMRIAGQGDTISASLGVVL